MKHPIVGTFKQQEKENHAQSDIFNLIIENPTLFDKVKLSSFTNLRHIPHPQTLFLRIP